MVQASDSVPSWILNSLYLFCPHDPVKGKVEKEGRLMDVWMDLVQLGDALRNWKVLPMRGNVLSDKLS